MPARPFLKTLLLCLLLGLALPALLSWKGEELLGETWPDLGKPETRYATLPWKAVFTWSWIMLLLPFFRLLSHLLSPERAVRRGRPAMPALLRDLVRYGLLIIAVAIGLRVIWGETLTPVLGALGVGGVILGLALQETLSNFFAGLALIAENPFAQGDWVQIGDRAEGKVEHITWRATRIRTRDNDYQIFPNNLVSKEVVVNFRQPDRRHALRLPVGTSYKDPPEAVKKTLLEVVASVPEVLKDPPPIVYLLSYGDFSINYEVKCFVDDYDLRPVIEDRIMHRIWYAFRRAGIEIPFPIRTVFKHEVPWEPRAAVDRAAIEVLLSSAPIFAPLSREELEALAARTRTLEYAAGEPVLEQGAPGDALFAILSGRVRVSVRSAARSRHTVAYLGPGEIFGEMSLLTGEPRSASVDAEEAVVLCQVSREALSPILQANPAVAERIAQVVAQRREHLATLPQEEAPGRAGVADPEGARRSLLERIRRFFRIDSPG